MSTEKSSVVVELFDLAITERKDDRFGRVVINKSLNEDDLISIAVTRRTDLNPTTLKASIEILKQIGIEQVANGASVRFGLGYFTPGVNGVFIGDNAKWNSSQHSLSVRTTPVAELRNAVKGSTVNVRGMSSSGLAINSVTDVTSGEVNGRLTPGGAVNLTGSRIKIEGDAPNVGISLINQETGEATIVPRTSIAINDPSRITFVVPATLAIGDYNLAITTQFSSSGKGIQLKEPRSFTFEYVLNVTA